MTRFKSLLVAGLLLSAVACPAFAQGTAPTLEEIITLDETPAENEITVSATPDPKPDQRAVTQQVRAITRTGNLQSQPIALFQNALCPGVLGLPVDAAEWIVTRIRDNAERFGLRLANPGTCSPNFVVGFVGSGKADVEKMLEKKGSMLAMLTVDERRELLSEPGPVYAWQVTTVRSLTGAPLAGQANDLTKPQVLSGNASHSLISLSARRDIDLSVVLIDVAAIDGMSVVQLADYATMRGIARTRPVEGEAGYDTILNLFDENAMHHRELTTFDIAYLESLYSGLPNMPGAAKIGSVKRNMDKALALGGHEPEPATN